MKAALQAVGRHLLDLVWCRGNHPPYWPPGATRPHCAVCQKPL